MKLYHFHEGYANPLGMHTSLEFYLKSLALCWEMILPLLNFVLGCINGRRE